MKKSEVIEQFRAEIEAAMVKRYRAVIECYGRIQYQIYIWEDGEIECLEGPQGDNSWLQAKDYEPRELFYVTTIEEPCFDPWDAADHSAPEDDKERESEERELIDWYVDEYSQNVSNVLDIIITEAEQREDDIM